MTKDRPCVDSFSWVCPQQWNKRRIDYGLISRHFLVDVQVRKLGERIVQSRTHFCLSHPIFLPNRSTEGYQFLHEVHDLDSTMKGPSDRCICSLAGIVFSIGRSFSWTQTK